MKKRKNIFELKTFLSACLLFFCLFLSETKTSQAALGTAECNAKGGSCDFTCIGSDYESLGDCDYGMKICCRKKLVDTSGGDPDPKGTGNFAPGTCGSSGEGTCKYNVAIGGTICGDDKNIGQDNCPWSYSCCVPKAAATTNNTSQPAATTNNTSPSTLAPQPSAPAAQVNPAVGTGYADIINNGLVPCGTSKYPAPCTLCHLIIGFHRIFTFLLGLLITATLLAITGAGVFYMVSTGNKGMMDTAKQALTYALTAFALGLGSWLVVTMILTAFGFNNAGSWWNFSCDATQSQGASSVANNVGTTSGAGTSSGTPNGNCGGMKTTVSEQCKVASSSLSSLMDCMSKKGAPGTVTSISASNVGGNLEKAKACCGDPSCIHATYSCHYGCGMSDQGYSHAMDIGTNGWSESQLCQLASIAKECGAGAIWGPSNMACGIRYQSGHGTHLHISTAACNH